MLANGGWDLIRRLKVLTNPDITQVSIFLSFDIYTAKLSVPSLRESKYPYVRRVQSHIFWYLPKSSVDKNFRKFFTPLNIHKRLAYRVRWRGSRVGWGGFESAWTVLGSLISGSGRAYSSHALYQFVAQNRNKKDVPQTNKQNKLR